MAQNDDDFVEYFLFPRLPTLKAEKPVKIVLDDLRVVYRSYLANYLDDYLWQKEPFSLTAVVSPTGDASTPPHLHGITRFGCNVDDEWFIVFLIFELTKAFPDLVVRVVDNDNEFLLIEMAEQIPKWLDPQNAVNRVYIHQGSVHIIPRSTEKGPLSSLPSKGIALSEGVAAVREYSNLTKCDNKTQRVLLRRIGAFPDKIQENLHRANCFLPATAAVILKESPTLLPLVVDAFVDRDQSDLDVCRMMRYFPPETRVLQRVTFTKFLYAQLSSQKIQVDSRIGWKMPSSGSSMFKSYDLGMKIACGFEILVNIAKQTANKSFDEKDPLWVRYVTNLQSKGYFQNEIEGSKLYQQLMNNAKRHFNDNKRELQSLHAGQQILNMLDNVHIDVEELEREAKLLPPSDDDSWMELSVQQLDDILRNKWSDESDIASTVTNSLNSFVNHRSDVEGAEFPMLRNDAKHENKSNRVTLDPDSFADVMNSILDFKVPEWEEGSSSDMSEYSDEDDDELAEKIESTKAVNNMKNYVDKMDRELAQTSVGQSFDRVPNTKETEAELDHYSPVDVDLTALRNILESFRCQGPDPGPASNLLSSMGVALPQNTDD